MARTPKIYQRKAVKVLKDYFDLALKSSSSNSIVFKSPTGSGKTFMMSMLLSQIVSEYSGNGLTFIWCSIGKGQLADQSHDAMSEYLGGYPKCNLLTKEFCARNLRLPDNEITFVNWEKLIQKDTENHWKNNLMKDDDTRSFLKILDNTRSSGTTIVLIVDEADIGEKNDSRIKEFRDTIICPKVTFEMSATPVLTNHNFFYEVPLSEPIKEGMIKDQIIGNDGLKELAKLPETTSREMVLTAAYNKRQLLKKAFEDEGSSVNPLVLIQIPDDREDDPAGEEKIQFIREFMMNKFGVTESNGQLAIYLDDYAPFDKKEIRKIDNPISFLVFKTAVARGWDCPRAQILVRFRQVKSEPFTIQTLGRIMRMPEGHAYKTEILNKGYIYQNIDGLDTAVDIYTKGLVYDTFVNRKDGLYFPHPLKKVLSYFETRSGAFNDATQEYYSYFEDAFVKFFHINPAEAGVYHLSADNIYHLKVSGLDVQAVAKEDVMDSTTFDTDSFLDKNKSFNTDSFKARSAIKDIEEKFYSIIDSNLAGLARVRSESCVKMAIISTFQSYLGIVPTKNGIVDCERIVVANEAVIGPLIKDSCQKFKDDKYSGNSTRNGVYGPEYYDIPGQMEYLKETHAEVPGANKCVMASLYMLKKGVDLFGDKVNLLEKSFIFDVLEKDPRVVWYFVNGTGELKKYFGIDYHDANGDDRTFKPDFLVMYQDGTLGIFDTKPICGHDVSMQDRLADIACKHKGLIDYLNEYNKGRSSSDGKIIGGMVVKPNPSSNVFYVFNSSGTYEDYDISTSHWTSYDSFVKGA